MLLFRRPDDEVARAFKENWTVENGQEDEKNQKRNADTTKPFAAALRFIARRVHTAGIKTRMAAKLRAAG